MKRLATRMSIRAARSGSWASEHYLACLDPASGQFRKFDLEQGAGPHNVVVDRAGTR
jgi:streptogramin lyase